jgi:hypothetical protein
VAEAVTGLKVVRIVPDGLSKHMQTQSPLTKKVTTFMVATNMTNCLIQSNMPNYKMVGEPCDKKFPTCRLFCQGTNHHRLISIKIK